MEAVIIGIAVVVVIIFVAVRRRRSSAAAAVAMKQLRERALTTDATDLGITPAAGVAWAAIMETGYPGAVASLVTFADGSASLYFSTGGGIIGGGAHANVNQAARAFVMQASEAMQHFKPATGHPPPNEGITQFYIRTDTGLHTAVAPENELGEGAHPLSHLFYSGQDVITQLRLISENAP